MTGIPYALLPNLNAESSTRSFLEDPYVRLENAQTFDKSVRPSEAAIGVLETVLNSENRWVRELVNWSKEDMPCARLVLKWPGTTSSVRAFTVDPATSVRQPRTIFVTRRDEDQMCTIQSSAPEYAPLMWPLAFPSGDPAVLADGRPLDAAMKGVHSGAEHATLAMVAARESNRRTHRSRPRPTCAHASAPPAAALPARAPP